MTVLNLPIDTLKDNILAHQGVKIITASFGAGKTIRVPKWLADHRDEQFLVIPPKRRLAQAGANAMTSVYADPNPLRYGYFVRGAHTRTYNKSSKVLFTTPGIALHRGLVHSHQNFILDEVQEQSMLHTCISSILKRRMDSGDNIDLTLMSATIDPTSLLEYWKDHNPEVFTCDTAMDVPIIDTPYGDPIGSVSQLIEDGHKGIIVFVDGERTIREMRQRLVRTSAAMHIPFHISVAHSNMAMADLMEADAPTTEGAIRILLSTNVSESGVRYRWKPTAVVSTGEGKCFVEKNGLSTLYRTDLTQDRILQQSGRVSDTAPDSVMILHGTPFKDRPVSWPSENSRLPVEYLVKTAIGVGEDPLTLDFEDISDEDVIGAIDRLRALGVLTDTNQITKAGAFVMGIPDSYRAGLLLYHASMIGCLQDAILPAVAITSGKFYRRCNLDDPEDTQGRAVMSLRSMVADIANTWGKKTGEIAEYAKRYNISLRSLYDAHNRVTAIVDALNVVPTLIRYQTLSPHAHTFSKEIEECVLASHIDMVYGVTINDQNKRRCVTLDGEHMSYALHHAPTGDTRISYLAVAHLKTNGVTLPKADSACMIRSEAIRSYIAHTETPFRHNNPAHQRLLHIANKCLYGKDQSDLLGMLPTWAETVREPAMHDGDVSNAFMIYQDERDPIIETDDDEVELPNIKPRHRVNRANKPAPERSIIITQDALLMERLVGR